jgi:hypothetical protein
MATCLLYMDGSRFRVEDVTIPDTLVKVDSRIGVVVSIPDIRDKYVNELIFCKNKRRKSLPTY